MSTADAAAQWVAPRLSGGIGNRLFQFAAAAGAAEAWGRSLVICLPLCRPFDHGPAESLWRMFPTVPRLMDAPAQYTEVAEIPRLHYVYMPFDPCAPNSGPILIQGYRQSPLYFPRAGIRVDWFQTLGPERAAMIASGAGLLGLEERRRTVALHVRLGDYLELPHHQQPLGAYYLDALKRVARGMRIHLFSDEPAKCTDLFKGVCGERGLELTVAEVRLDIESLYEFTLCLGGTIVANSTFSWWGAYFAHTEGAAWATYPDKWGKGQPPPTDLVPEWGITLPTGEF